MTFDVEEEGTDLCRKEEEEDEAVELRLDLEDVRLEAEVEAEVEGEVELVRDGEGNDVLRFVEVSSDLLSLSLDPASASVRTTSGTEAAKTEEGTLAVPIPPASSEVDLVESIPSTA